MNDLIQVIEHLNDGKHVRVYKIVSAHIGDEDDPLTTIEIKGSEYETVNI